MKNKRRDFLKQTALTGIGVAGANIFRGLAQPGDGLPTSDYKIIAMENKNSDPAGESVIGLYGPWFSAWMENKLPSLSFRNETFTNLKEWKTVAKERVMARMSIPNIGGTPKATVKKQYVYDGLIIEELSWQLPYGRPTDAILLKPENAKGKLPAILAFHDHGGNKYFGTRKITRTSDGQHEVMQAHQKEYYEGMAWANEIAKRGYVVLVPDAFPFASRRVMMQDVPDYLRNGLNDTNPEEIENINKYNEWAGDHEHVMAKSLYCAGTTWPGVFFAEDQKALDILCAREDVDTNRIGCGGLSGGGMRTVFMAGLDERIKCAVPVGFMTTWRDFLLHKSPTHTWMVYVPLLPTELDFPEILSLRTPLATLVLNDKEDGLYTIDEMRRADKILNDIYQKAGAADHYKCNYYPGPHKFDKQMQADAFDWFDKWLKD